MLILNFCLLIGDGQCMRFLPPSQCLGDSQRKQQQTPQGFVSLSRHYTCPPQTTCLGNTPVPVYAPIVWTISSRSCHALEIHGALFLHSVFVDAWPMPVMHQLHGLIRCGGRANFSPLPICHIHKEADLGQ
jgi:hypothetical protein